MRRAGRTPRGRADVTAAAQSRDQLGEHPPGRPRHSRCGLRLEVALHAAVPVHKRALFFGDVGDRQHDLGVAGALGEDRPDVDQRPCRAKGDVGLIEHQHQRRRLGRRDGRRIVLAIPQQLGPPTVGCPLRAEREVRDPCEGRFLAHDQLEGAAPLEPAEQLPREIQRLRRGLGRDERDRLAARSTQPACHDVERLVPVGGVQLAPPPHQRGFDAVTAVHPAVVHPPVVADEVAIHLEVRPWAHPHHDVLAGVERDVAPLRAAGADGGRLVELPGARLVQEILGEERADRAQIHDIARPRMVQASFGMDPDVGTVAALRDVEHRLLGDVLHEADAARAQDAAVRDVQHVGAEVLDGVEALGVIGTVPRGGAAFLEREILQLALSRLVADRTVEWVIDEQQLEHPHAAALGLSRLGAHHHAFRHLGGAGDLQLRCLFDVHQAHAAHARYRQTRVVAVVRHEYARLLGGLDHERSLGDAHWDSVDSEVDEIVGHQATMTGFRRPAI